MKYLKLLTVSLPFYIHSQSLMIENGNYVTKQSHNPYLWVWANSPIDSSNFKINTFSLINPKSNWSEVFVGPSYTHSYKTGLCEFGILPGFETDKSPFRVMSYVFHKQAVGSGSVKSFIDFEYGGSGYWYVWYSQYQTKQGIIIGLQGQSFNGVWGPKIGYTKLSFTGYFVSGYNLEKKEFGLNLGLRTTF